MANEEVRNEEAPDRLKARVDGVSRLTAMAIQENPDVYTYVGQYKEGGGWLGVVECIDAKDRPRMLLTTEDNFGTAEEAKDFADRLVAAIRAMPPAFGTPDAPGTSDAEPVLQ